MALYRALVRFLLELAQYEIRLTTSAAVIPETPTALSGIFTNAGALCDPGLYVSGG
jgi:hypothetical protein